MTAIDEEFMRQALAQAEEARLAGEVPVGAVLVIDGQIRGRGHNAVITESDPTAHAEVMALRDAARQVRNYRLVGAVLYSTIEPCAMCAGAIVHSRIDRLVFGTRDDKAGAVDSHFGICNADFLNHRVKVESGILESDCRAVIQSFFLERRKADSGAERCESG